jgi:signal transduction histidine kinase
VSGDVEKIHDGLASSSFDDLIDKAIERNREHILDSYEELLASSGTTVNGKYSSPLHVRTQAAAVLDEVRRRLGDPNASNPGPASEPKAPIRRTSARQASHPSESLREAHLLCHAILSGIVASLPARPELVPAVVRVAVITHRVIMENVAKAAMSYTSYLVERLHQSHADERRRVARELHDLVAHSVALALQNLELFVMYRDRDPERAPARLDGAFRQLREATDVVRSLAQDLRRSGADEGLRYALVAYVDSIPEGPPVEVRFDGDEDNIPEAIRGELFLVLREGVHNARTHAQARSIQVDVEIHPRWIRASVVDDGVGFDETSIEDGTGLESMRERVALMGGTILVSSKPGQGAAIHIEVPMVGMRDG